MTIGERLKELRNGLSQRAVAQAVGIKQQVWNRYEKDETAPASDSIIKICNYFGRSADWLLGIDRGTSAANKVMQRGNGNISQIGNGNTARDCSNCASKQLADLMKQLGITVADLASVAAKKSAAKPPRKK